MTRRACIRRSRRPARGGFMRRRRCALSRAGRGRRPPPPLLASLGLRIWWLLSHDRRHSRVRAVREPGPHRIIQLAHRGVRQERGQHHDGEGQGGGGDGNRIGYTLAQRERCTLQANTFRASSRITSTSYRNGRQTCSIGHAAGNAMLASVD